MNWITLARPFAAERRWMRRLVRQGQDQSVLDIIGDRAVTCVWVNFRNNTLPQILPPLCDSCAHWSVMDGKGGWCDRGNTWAGHFSKAGQPCGPTKALFEEREGCDV